jgi:hypothetical protein
MYIWHSKTAFGVKDHEKLTHDMMIVCFRKALDKWIAFENKSNEGSYSLNLSVHLAFL